MNLQHKINAGQPRQGFTLVEMMVAITLTLFIMVIVSTAFVTGLDTFRGMKGIGDMQGYLRSATQRLRSDLQANHFEGKRRLSAPYFWNKTKTEGFLRIEQIPPDPNHLPFDPNVKPDTNKINHAFDAPFPLEGMDLDGIPSLRTTTHRLHFSVRLLGSRSQDFLNAVIDATIWPSSPLNPDPNNANYKRTTYFSHPPDTRFQSGSSYSSQWAEVAYHLVKTGTTQDLDDPEFMLVEDKTKPDNLPSDKRPIPLYSLYRIQRVVVPDNSGLDSLVSKTEQTSYAEMSCQVDADPNKASFLHFNSPADLAQGIRSISFPQNISLEEWQNKPYVSPYPGASLLLNNVVSFQVQVLKVGGTDFEDVGPFFDTAQPPNPLYNLSAIKITLRVWDAATQQSLQISMIQDL